jgi:hypothetical protein
VERLENFSSNGKEYLADGVALRVHLPGGKASVRLGQSRQDFELAAGSYLVYSKNGDYVLVPLADGDDVE